MIYENMTPSMAHTLIENKQILYAIAYDINNETLHTNLRATPTKGILTEDSKWGRISFVPLNKRGEPRQSGKVAYVSRKYADTYEEAVTLYNSLVQKRVNLLKEHLKFAEEDFI